MKPLILMYHRIADEPVDYWGLAVSPDHFEQQLSVLRRTRRPLPLIEFVRRLVDGDLSSDAVALTFDDGYVDNLTTGLPRLAAAEVPATVFLATGFLDRAEPFWWDELASLLLCARGSNKIELELAGKPLALVIDGGSKSDENTMPVAWHNPHEGLEALYHPLRFLAEDERAVAMSKLRSAFSECSDRGPLARPMTSAEVRALVADGLVTIGSHTITHPSLPALDRVAREREIVGSKLACGALASAPVKALSYPFGEYNAETRETAKAAGFAFACSTRLAPTISASDIFALRRLYIPNVDGDGFEMRLRLESGTDGV